VLVTRAFSPATCSRPDVHPPSLAGGRESSADAGAAPRHLPVVLRQSGEVREAHAGR
jgi:hypothetical protein